MERGVVLAGGSAGAICWFDGGHSDSMDPASYKRTGEEEWVIDNHTAYDSKQTCDDKDPESKSGAWEYIRVPCLGYLPGLVVPHADKIQSNGVLRSDDFDAMLKRHPTERGIQIDHWAAIVVENGRYKVI